MKRFLLSVVALVVASIALAQSPEAIREQIRQYPNLSLITHARYPSYLVGDIAATPKGFTPFYFSLAGRHGSRYQTETKDTRKIQAVFAKADSLGILTELGKRLHQQLTTIKEVQKGHDGELTPLGYEQWLGIAHRAYERFTPIFSDGSIRSASSNVLRCVFSMTAFNQGIKERNPQIEISQSAQYVERPIVLPMTNGDKLPKALAKIQQAEVKALCQQKRNVWNKNCDASTFISKVTTDRERLMKECGGKDGWRVLRYTIDVLGLAENFDAGNQELFLELFTPEDMYDFYVYRSLSWALNLAARGLELTEAATYSVHTMVEDILSKAEAAIEGKNPHRADLRFSHDTHIAPLISVLAFEGFTPTYHEDAETIATSTFLSRCIPMAANVQIVLYRDTKGKVYARALLNEHDMTLPIKCKTAPFYPWEQFRAHIEKNMQLLATSRKNFVEKHK